MLSRWRRVDLDETLKDTVLHDRFNANPCVSDFDDGFNMAVIDGPDIKGNRDFTQFGEFDRIANQVTDNLAHPERISGNSNWIVSGDA